MLGVDRFDKPSTPALPSWWWRALMATGVVSALATLGCPTLIEFHPQDENDQLVMFHRYIVYLSGYNYDRDETFCEVYFTEPISTKARLDSIPIFTMDSICFAGDCLDSNLCHVPVSLWDDPAACREEWHFLTHDLGYWSFENKLIPGQFRIRHTALLPSACRLSTVNMTLHAHLTDRMSGKVIASETKTASMKIRHTLQLIQ